MSGESATWKSQAITIPPTTGAVVRTSGTTPLGLSSLARVSKTILDLLHAHPTEDPGGLEEEHPDEEGEDVDVAEVGREVGGPEELHEADEEPAQHGTTDVPDAADDGGHEGLEPEEDPGGGGGLVQ